MSLSSQSVDSYLRRYSDGGDFCFTVTPKVCCGAFLWRAYHAREREHPVSPEMVFSRERLRSGPLSRFRRDDARLGLGVTFRRRVRFKAMQGRFRLD
jgi:hypothetical protein